MIGDFSGMMFGIYLAIATVVVTIIVAVWARWRLKSEYSDAWSRPTDAWALGPTDWTLTLFNALAVGGVVFVFGWETVPDLVRSVSPVAYTHEGALVAGLGALALATFAWFTTSRYRAGARAGSLWLVPGFYPRPDDRSSMNASTRTRGTPSASTKRRLARPITAIM